jgi:mono/diheme cytochrome c family protein
MELMGAKSSFCLVGVFVLSLAGAFVGCRQPSAENGRALFNENCVRCHAQQPGHASPAPSLAGYFYRNPHPTLRQAQEVIREGKRAMPPFGQRLSTGEIDDVIEYIKTLR